MTNGFREEVYPGTINVRVKIDVFSSKSAALASTVTLSAEAPTFSVMLRFTGTVERTSTS
jgi:hypothetical protein